MYEGSRVSNESRGFRKATAPAKAVLLCVAACVSGLVIAACGDSGDDTSSSADTGATANSEPLKIGVIHDAVFDDGAYGQEMLNAIESAVESTGVDATIQKVERVPYSEEMTFTTRQLLQQGTDLVIDVAAGGELVTEACKEFPDQYCLTLYPVSEMPPNTAGAWADEAPFYYLEGIAAGMLTETGNVGFVGAVPSNLGYALENSYTLGCQSVRPDCEVNVVYLNSYFDPPKAVESTQTLLNSGADVIAHQHNDASVLKTAADAGKWSYGMYVDQRDVAPEHYVTAMIYAPAFQASVEKTLTAIVDGGPLPGGANYGPGLDVSYGSDEPMDIALPEFGENVPDDVQQAVQDAWDALNNGESPYTGPIKDSEGVVQIPEGETKGLRSKFIYSGWDWAVQGLIGG